jgi:hypothetical protein
VLGKIGAQVRVVVCFECKGVSRSSSSSLNRNKERMARGGGGIPRQRRLPLMAVAITVKGLRKE